TVSGCENTPKGYMSKIREMVEKGELPKSALQKIDEEIITNVLDDNYHSKKLDDLDMRSEINPEGYVNNYTFDNYILKHAMDLPLETLPVATNLLGILTSPYIEKKANTEDELGVSRYDLNKAGNPNLPDKYSKVYDRTEKLYEETITPIISEVLSGISGISDG
ncbi:MAG: hypothetical protein LUG16_00545, partial [Candidatus Gastranaerophilales bacterium]|nr:hypothetical protein [Candidatus Gastranaerophilales bacterium]